MDNTPHPPVLASWPCLPGRQLPAYAAPLAQARARDLVPAGRQVVIHLDRWPRSGVSPLGPVICCPPGVPPDRLEWRYLAALNVLVQVPRHAQEARLRGLVRELVAVRPLRLILLRPWGTPAAQFIISAARGLEVPL
jgi:hypothetical protein